jgi:hypothetical protein
VQPTWRLRARVHDRLSVAPALAPHPLRCHAEAASRDLGGKHDLSSDQPGGIRHGKKGKRMVLGIGGFSSGKAGGPYYEIEVNEGSVNMRHFTKIANQRADNGYRIAHVYSQDRNTIVVWERTSG